MAGPIQTLLIGTSLLVLIMLGGFTFMVNAYDIYGIPSNSTSALNATREYLNTINQTTTQYQGFINDEGSIEIGVFSFLGLIFQKLGEFVVAIFNIGVLFTQMITGFQQSSPLFVIPNEFITMIGGIVTIILIISGIALVIGKSSDNI